MNSKAVATLMRGRMNVPDFEEAQQKAAEQQAAAEEQQRAQEAAREAQRRQQQGQMRREYGNQTYPNPYANYSTTRESYEGQEAQRQAAQNAGRRQAPVQPAKAEPKVGRNDPCPCGSGKKYKNCHGKGQ